MFSPGKILLVTVGYLLILFAVAQVGDRLVGRLGARGRSLVIALAMGTYCTAWTFFGTLSQAAHYGWHFPPTFLGSCITLVLGFTLLSRLLQRSRQFNSTSIADFISSQYGKSDAVAGLVTVVACIAVLPYIALQLKAVSMSLHVLTGGSWEAARIQSTPLWSDETFALTLLMALFAVVYGTREFRPTERHTGLLVAMGFESIIKLVAFALVALYVTYVLFDGVNDLVIHIARNQALVDQLRARSSDGGYASSIVLGMAAIFCLPRHFHILAVESTSTGDLRATSWVITIYLLIIALLVLLLTYGGLAWFNGFSVNPESYPISVPVKSGMPLLALVGYVGGLSAATSMVILAAIALATMLSNSLVIPILLRMERYSGNRHADFTGMVKTVRRLAIFALLLLAYGYYRYLSGATDLPTIGLLAMTLVAQFAPVIIAALFNVRCHPHGVIAGVFGGTLVWAYTLLLPALAESGWSYAIPIHASLLGIPWLQPNNLLDIGLFSPLGNGVFWSLVVNCSVFFTAARFYRRHEVDAPAPPLGGPELTVARLRDTAARFIGADQARFAIAEHLQERNLNAADQEPAGNALIEYVEMLLAGVIGASSAKHVIVHAAADLSARSSSPDDILEETSQVFQFSRGLLESSLDQISQGISVIDPNLRLVAWNRRYLELFRYPDNMIHVGRHVTDLIRYNAERGDCGPGPVEEHVSKRLQKLQDGRHYVFHRKRADGTILEIRGSPLPGGGYVTTYTDITEFIRALNEVQSARDELEDRVKERTAELTQTNRQLETARQQADQANWSKTKFLASAGHDLIQPLNAAKLFVSTLQQREMPADDSTLLGHVSSSLQSAETLIIELLEIAKIDAGIVKPKPGGFRLADVFPHLYGEFSATAQEKGLQFRCLDTACTVRSDPVLLKRILQNLLANAIKYTDRGGRVLLGCRRHGNETTIEVWDTGCGIPEEHREDIFTEFKRLDTGDNTSGMGLGLSTVQRLCRLLNHELTVSSRPGRGSVFRVRVPLAPAQVAGAPGSLADIGHQFVAPRLQLKVLVVDNELHIRESIQTLISEWGGEVTCCGKAEEVMALADSGYRPELLLVDYHLNSDCNGIELARRYLHTVKLDLPCIVISADRSELVREEIQRSGFLHIQKPLKPLKLRQALARYARSGPAASAQVY